MKNKIQSYIAEQQHLARRCMQVLFLMVVIGIGIRFYLFVSQLEAGILPDFERPPGVWSIKTRNKPLKRHSC